VKQQELAMLAVKPAIAAAIAAIAIGDGPAEHKACKV
jgi:hypothetical protein